MTRTPLAIFALLVGCAGRPAPPALPTAYEVRIDPSWTDPSPVLQALADWTTATNVQFFVSVSADICPSTPGSHCFAVLAEPWAEVQSECGQPAPGYSFAGCTFYGGASNPEAESSSGVWFNLPTTLHILRHEIGHQLGLSHNPSTDAVMYWSIDAGSPTITALDVEAYWSLRPGVKQAQQYAAPDAT